MGLGLMLYSSALKLDLKADAISGPINVAHQFRDFPPPKSGLGIIPTLAQR